MLVDELLERASALAVEREETQPDPSGLAIAPDADPDDTCGGREHLAPARERELDAKLGAWLGDVLGLDEDPTAGKIARDPPALPELVRESDGSLDGDARKPLCDGSVEQTPDGGEKRRAIERLRQHVICAGTYGPCVSLGIVARGHEHDGYTREKRIRLEDVAE
jgi:hypothetical protein